MNTQIGFELELESQDGARLSYEKLLEFEKECDIIQSADTDISVFGGCELRTFHPELKYWNIDGIKQVLNKAKDMQLCNTYGTAGMHVHLSGEKTKKTWDRINKFSDKIYEILLPISCRRKYTYSPYKGFKMLYYGINKNFYRCSSHDTLEIRIFNATMNEDVIFNRLKFCKYLFEFLESDKPFCRFFSRMPKEIKSAYEFLLNTENPHKLGMGREKALKLLK